MVYKLFHARGPYHIKTSPLTCSANHWIGVYMVGTSVMKKLNKQLILTFPGHKSMLVTQKDVLVTHKIIINSPLSDLFWIFSSLSF